MSIKIIFILMLSLFCVNVFSQKLVITPSVGVKFSKTRYREDTRGQQTFYSNYQQYPNVGIEFSSKLHEKYWVFLKYRTIPIPVTYKGLKDEDPGGWYGPLFGGNSSGAGYPCSSLSVGVARILKNVKGLRNIKFYGDLNIGFSASVDSLGGSGGYNSYSRLRYVDFTEYRTRRTFPFLSVGLRHKFVNRKQKEVFSFDINYHFGFQYVAIGKIKYQLYDYDTRTLSTQYSVLAGNKVNSMSFSITKDIRLIK